MKTTELAQWHEYESSGETLISINIVNFKEDPKILNFYMDASFQIVDSLKFDKNTLFICEKLPNQTGSVTICKNKYFYFMYNRTSGIFVWDDSNSKDKSTIDSMADKAIKSLNAKQTNIENCFIGGSFIRELKTPEQLKTIIKPYSYRGFAKKNTESLDKSNLNPDSKSQAMVTKCLKIMDSLNHKNFQRG